METILELDRELFLYLNSWGSESYDYIWLYITQIMNAVPLFLFVFTFIIWKLNAKHAFKIIGTTLLLLIIAFILTELTKITFQRLRPLNEPLLEGKVRRLIEARNYSFFSGHSAVSFAISSYLVLMLKERFPWILILWFWATLFSYSRIYTGAHYPLDVLVGITVGAILALYYFKFIQQKMELKVIPKLHD